MTGGLADFTWHLSIIDGGAPRGQLPQDGGANAAFVEVAIRDGIDWRAVELNAATWSKMSVDSGQAVHVGQSVFGAPGAIPVTGDFDGDGRSEIGVFINGHWYLDLDGDGRWSESDLWAKLGDKLDKPVTGDWDGDGKDDIGIFGPMWDGDPPAIEKEPGVPDVANRRPLALKNLPPGPSEATNGERILQKSELGRTRSDLIDHVFGFGNDGQRPIAGDFNGDGVSTIGVFSNGEWRLDANGDGRWNADEDTQLQFGQPGDIPLVGDFDGDGIDDISVMRGREWIIDSDGDQELTVHDRVFEIDGAGGVPVTGDWDGDGRDDIGFFRETSGS